MRSLSIFCLVMMKRIESKSIECLFRDQCRDMTFNCPDGEDCNLKCDYVDACYGVTLNCPSDANCYVRCATWYQGQACYYINVNCPTSGNCNIDCSEQSTCLFAEANWSPDPYTNTLNCGDYNTGCLSGFTVPPTKQPTSATPNPTIATLNPTAAPSSAPTSAPTMNPTQNPSVSPSNNPTNDPTSDPTIDPTNDPTIDPTVDPTSDPTTEPTIDPTSDPTIDPTNDPTIDPTIDPTTVPTLVPTMFPTKVPTTAFPTFGFNAQTPAPSSAPIRPEKEVGDETDDISNTILHATTNAEEKQNNGKETKHEGAAKEDSEELQVVIGVLGGALSVIVLVAVIFGILKCAKKKNVNKADDHIQLTNVVPSHVVSMQSDGESAVENKVGPGYDRAKSDLPELPDEDAKLKNNDNKDVEQEGEYGGNTGHLMITARDTSDEDEELFGAGPVTKDNEQKVDQENISSDSDNDSLFENIYNANDKQTKTKKNKSSKQ